MAEPLRKKEMAVKRKKEEVAELLPPAKRAKRSCPLCPGIYAKLTDHLKKKHKLSTWEERQPFMEQAFQKTPDLRIQSEFRVWVLITIRSICLHTQLKKS